MIPELSMFKRKFKITGSQYHNCYALYTRDWWCPFWTFVEFHDTVEKARERAYQRYTIHWKGTAK